MNCYPRSERQRGGRLQRAMTLIELIGVLTIIAILAGCLFPVMLRHLDRLAAERETASLEALDAALQRSILRYRAIPSHTNWATVVAAEAGLDIGAVTNNLRRQSRAFLIDPSGWLATNLPYTQTSQGTTSLPLNARLMLVSSLGESLPITSGMPSAAEFASLWDAPEGTLPATGPWSGWSGSPEDVLIHRINLSPLFVNLVLSTYVTSITNGQYSIDNTPAAPPYVAAPRSNGVAAYFLQGTVLKLYTGWPSNSLDATQILGQDTSFVYEAGVWKNSILGGVTFGGSDISGIVAAFLAATPNTNAPNKAGNAQQVAVVDSFIKYMSNYNLWASGTTASGNKPFGDGNLQKYLQDTVQPTMMDTVQGLYGSINGTNYYPSNGGP